MLQEEQNDKVISAEAETNNQQISRNKAGKRDHAARRTAAKTTQTVRIARAKEKKQEEERLAAEEKLRKAREKEAAKAAGSGEGLSEAEAEEAAVSAEPGTSENEAAAAGVESAGTSDQEFGTETAADKETPESENQAAEKETEKEQNPDTENKTEKKTEEAEKTEKTEKDEADDEPLPIQEIDEEVPPAKKKKRRLVTALLVTGIVLLSLIVTGILAALGVFNYFYNKSNYVAEGETYIPTAKSTEATTLPPIKEGVNYSIVGTTESTTETTTAVNETEPSINRTGVYNVLLLGVDIGSGNGNSDSMIVCSINYDLHKIFLTTIMRDLEAEVPEYGTRKLNSACAIGGPTLLRDTLQESYGFEIDNFAMIDFEGMKAVIDALGGVNLQITVDEAKFMLIDMDQDQVLHLDGRLALRHARDRSSGGSDFGRTQRQRNVLMAIVRKARSGEIGDIVEAAKAILPYITHDMSRMDLAELLSELPVLIKWEFVQQRLPYDGMFEYANENLVMDVPQAMERWHQVVYDGAVFEDTIVEASTEESAEEETEPSGEEIGNEDGTADEGADPEGSEQAESEEPDLIPDDLLKLPDGVYKVSYHADQYLNPIPADFNYNNLITITSWKDVKTMEELDALLPFEAAGEQAVGRQLAIHGGEYYIGSRRQNRFWKLLPWDGTLAEETAE